MWSAIPVVLLCVFVNITVLTDSKQGSGPKGDDVLQNTGGPIEFVRWGLQH